MGKLAALIAEQEERQNQPGHAQEIFLSLAHGFLPARPPLQAFPESHQAWDQLAEKLPHLVEQGQVTPYLQETPSLSGTDLPAEYLCRAASILGIVAHACIREQDTRKKLTPHLEVQLPKTLETPWETVCQRLGRPGAGMTYSDLILYNWKLRDPDTPRIVENFALLTPVYGSEEERIFYMTMAEMHDVAARCLPALLSLESAQTAQTLDGVETALLEIQQALQTMTYDSLLKIDPNPASPLHVDHLVWAKTVAPFAFPIREGELGLSGGGSPIFHFLDFLFQRKDFESQIGQELLHLRQWMPPAMQAFLQGVSELKLPEWIKEQGSQTLKNLYQQTFEAYAGERGWLGLHRLKVYGFMEVGFKAGRTQTNGGFEGDVEDRAWETLDNSINQSRQERYSAPKVGRCPFAHHKQAQDTPAPGTQVRQVTLDIAQEGLSYQTGDRLGVHPLNSDELVDKTLQALEATGHESIPLNSVWKQALGQILDEEVGETLPLRQFLQHAKLRPLLRPVGKALYQLSRSRPLFQILEDRREDQLELWEAFDLLKASNFDLRRLWKAKAWQPESLAKLIPPERFRVYSISSAGEISHLADQVDLTIGSLQFESPAARGEGNIQRRGSASHFLTSEPQAAFPVQVVRPSRFRLPKEDTLPLVMFAGGTGISPFRGFWQSRQEQTLKQPDWLFLGVRTPEQFYYQAELAARVAAQALEVRVAFSRSDINLGWDAAQQTFRFESGERGRIQKVMLANAEALWQLLQPRSSGGQEGVFYICGQTRYAHSVIETLKTIIGQRLDIGKSDRAEAVDLAFRRLMAEGRLMMDIFTTFAPANSPGVLDYQIYHASDLIMHNNPQQGYWMTIQGNVYDMSEFMYLHPGGERLIRTNAGMDATRSYEQVEHHLNSEVHAMLDLFKIGRIQRLDFKERWGVAVIPNPKKQLETAAIHAKGMTYLTLHDAYRHWMRYTYQVVETENALRNNISLKYARLTQTDGQQYLNFIKAGLLLEVHQMFLDSYLPQLTGYALQFLWCITIGLCDAQAQVDHLEKRLQSLLKQASYTTAKNQISELARKLKNQTILEESQLELTQELTRIHQATLRLLRGIKLKLRLALQAFETHQDRVLDKGKQDLLEALLAIPTLLEMYYEDLVQDI